jgi:hypothetical protein
MSKYSIFWNKIWESSIEGTRRWKAELFTKYYITVNTKSDSNGRMESKWKTNIDQEDSGDENRQVNSRLKSGIEMSLSELNKLIPMISTFQMLTTDQLNALRNDEFEQWYSQEAESVLKMKGRQEEPGHIWVYPEMSIHEITLGKAAGIDKDGQVTSITEVKVHFLKPDYVHFVGMKDKIAHSSSGYEDIYSSSEDEEETKEAGDNHKEKRRFSAEGYVTEFDQRIELKPVQLVPSGSGNYK